MRACGPAASAQPRERDAPRRHRPGARPVAPARHIPGQSRPADRSRRSDVLLPLGDLSVNFNGEVEHFSDFGTLRTLGAGLNWSPIKQLEPHRLGHRRGRRAVDAAARRSGAGHAQCPGVRFRPRRDGRHQPDRRRQSRPARRQSPGVQARPQLRSRSTTRICRSTPIIPARRIRNPIASFPTATAEIEAAFPDRFLRDVTARLLRIDSRPVNFARSDREELRWGINFSKPIGPQPPPGGWRGAARAGGAGGARRRQGGGRPLRAARDRRSRSRRPGRRPTGGGGRAGRGAGRRAAAARRRRRRAAAASAAASAAAASAAGAAAGSSSRSTTIGASRTGS